MNKSNEWQKIQKLAKVWNFLIWQDSLQIPYLPHKIKKFSLLEKKFFFTFVKQEEKALVFLSPDSSIAEILQFSSFFKIPVEIYLTSSQLIAEKISQQKNTSSLDNNYISSLLQELLEFAANQKITDIHLNSSKKGNYLAQIRKDGKLQDYQHNIPQESLSKIKLLAKMDIATTRFPQDGHMNYTSKKGNSFDLRISTLPTVDGEKMVIRILPLENLELDLEKLNFPKNFIQSVKKALRAKNGWILIAGPTGSGKTTTLYCMVRELLKEKLNIMTVEDPVEYHLEGVNQVEVKEKIGLGFANILRAMLRQDPDVILIGEIRDEETAKIAAAAAQTGHLVLSTIHSGSVLETIQRFHFLNVNPEDLAGSLRLIVAQKLLFSRRMNKRIPVLEYIEGNKKIDHAILEKKSIAEIEKIIQADKFVSLKENAKKLGIDIWE